VRSTRQQPPSPAHPLPPEQAPLGAGGNAPRPLPKPAAKNHIKNGQLNLLRMRTRARSASTCASGARVGEGRGGCQASDARRQLPPAPATAMDPATESSPLPLRLLPLLQLPL
jgi:hypothetical protein